MDNEEVRGHRRFVPPALAPRRAVEGCVHPVLTMSRGDKTVSMSSLQRLMLHVVHVLISCLTL